MREDLEVKANKALAMLAECTLCPRKCRVNRLNGEIGFCQTGRLAKVSAFHLHFGEEAPLVGQGGSGTIFFAGCNLGCVFCQNYETSHLLAEAREVGPKELAWMMLALQGQGAENINLVTPSHVLPQILEALCLARDQGLSLPLVYNTSSYDRISILRLVQGVFDIFLPDCKFFSPDLAEQYCQARDYPERAQAAILEMHRQTGDLVLNTQGQARTGLLVRHLVLPNNLAGTKEWISFLAQHLSSQTYLNLMAQYHPCFKAEQFPELNRTITAQELSQAHTWAKEAGLLRLDRPPSTIWSIFKTK